MRGRGKKTKRTENDVGEVYDAAVLDGAASLFSPNFHFLVRDIQKGAVSVYTPTRVRGNVHRTVKERQKVKKKRKREMKREDNRKGTTVVYFFDLRKSLPFAIAHIERKLSRRPAVVVSSSLCS